LQSAGRPIYNEIMRILTAILILSLLAPPAVAAPCDMAGDMAGEMSVEMAGSPAVAAQADHEAGHDCCDEADEPAAESEADGCCEAFGACADCGLAAPALPTAFLLPGHQPGGQPSEFLRQSLLLQSDSPPYRPPIA
jgi:hypothetical protein